MEQSRGQRAGRYSRPLMVSDAPVAPIPHVGSEPDAGVLARLSLPPLAMAAFGFVAVAAVAAPQGGYFPSSWGWISLGMLWVAGLALVLRRRIWMGGRELVFLGALAALTLWTLLSVSWSVASSQSLLETERTLVYLAACAAVLLVARRRTTVPLLGGILAAIVAVSAYSLSTWLFPLRLGVEEPMTVYRLAEPIGYWNALGIFVAMGLLLALGFAAHGRTLAARAAAGASLVVLAPTLYFTFGRGPWPALAVGLAAAFVVSTRRLKLALTLLVVAPAPVVAVMLASQAESLSRRGASLSEAAAEGRRLGVAILLLAVAGAAAAAALALAERRVSVGPRVRFAFASVLVLALVAGSAGVFRQVGGPATLADKAYQAFTAPPPQVEDMSERLFNLSGNGRADLWRLAWDNYREHGWRGSGAGTYERYYLANKSPTMGKVRDAHGLYVELLSELGPVGLALLLVALAMPVVAGLSARRRRLVPAAVGAYLAFLAHAAIDWDWEVPAVTATALLCGSAILVAARGDRARPLRSPVRFGGAAVVTVVGVLASVALLGHAAIDRSTSLREAGRPAEAEREARSATRLLRWSPEPWEAVGEARLALGERARARAAFERAVEIDPGSWRLWLHLARASPGEERERALDRATELNPYGLEVTATRRALLQAEAEGG